MEKLVKSKQHTFDSICYIIKAMALFFCFYPLFDVFFSYSPSISMIEVNVSSLSFLGIMLLLVLCIWIILQTNAAMSPARKFAEIFVFFILCSSSIVASGATNSTYKFLFVLLIVTYTIQYGIRYGIGITCAASVTLLAIDIYAMKTTGCSSRNFQSDIAISFMFGIIVYILGGYVQLENDHIKELTKMANFDALTGLHNHRYFHEALEKLWNKANTGENLLSVIMMDIDYFKLYNDYCGHQMGDYALSRVASVIRKTIRPQDVACRYGGEEFAVILPDVTPEEALGIAEKVRVAVMDEEIDGEEYMPGKKLTISIGVSSVSSDDKAYSDSLTRADSALYRAKYLRKNRVEQYQGLFDRFTSIDTETKNALLPISGLLGIINVRDDYTYSHTERVAMCCEIVAKHIGLSDAETQRLLISAYMHDIGKIKVPREILISGRKLEPEEWNIMRNHPAASQDILKPIVGMEMVGLIVSEHHERYNGSGYPLGLKGDQIHPLAAILALADSFDAMTNDRPYQKRRSFDDALNELQAGAGVLYHPKYTKLFVEALRAEIESDEMKFSRWAAGY